MVSVFDCNPCMPVSFTISSALQSKQHGYCLYSLEVVQQPEMQRMVQNNPDLAHRMMVAIATQKRAKK